MKRFARSALSALGISTASAVVVCLMIAASAGAQKRVYLGNSSGNAPADTESVEDPNAVQPIDPTPEEFARIDDLILQLGAPRLTQRDRAMSELAGYEARALGQVREAKSHDDDEIAHRCALLEEVIQSGEGELFLALRQLNLTSDELTSHLNASDVTPLLNILRNRGQPGLVPLWAKLFASLSTRNQVFPAAELCREIEGAVGYGQALARAAAAPEAVNGSRNLTLLVVLLPPGDPADAVEALTQLRYSISGGRGLEEALGAARDLRNLYSTADALGALQGRPGGTDQDDQPEDAPQTRAAIGLTLIETCTPAELESAKVTTLEEMPTLLLSAWFALAKRSGHLDIVLQSLQQLLASEADSRSIGIAAGAYTSLAPVGDVTAMFPQLPYPAQLSVLDTLWLTPREPLVLQPFLIDLLENDVEGLREAAARALGQLRARSTVAALVSAATTRDSTGAMDSLRLMADLLTPEETAALAGKLPAAGLHTRNRIADVLVASGETEGLQPLLDDWRETLPRNELPLAFKVLSADPATAAGAYTAARLAEAKPSGAGKDGWLLRSLTNADLEMVRALLVLNDADGFALLTDMAGDPADPYRVPAMSALALAGRDGELIDDWIKRLTGEIKDPNPSPIGMAIALSQSDSANEFRNNTLQQGADSPHMVWVMYSVLNERGSITRAQLIDTLFGTQKSAVRWRSNWALIAGPLPDTAAHNLATALAFNDASRLVAQAGYSLLLREAGVDMESVLFGTSDNPQPRDPTEIMLTAALVDATRASEIIASVEQREDGQNYLARTIARSWLGLMEDKDENRRLATGIAADPTGLFGALRRLEQASTGDALALRNLLDAHANDSTRFKRGDAADISISEQRWGGPSMSITGVAEAAIIDDSSPPPFPSSILTPLFADAPPDEWRDWWASRRALLTYDETAGAYTFVELP